MSRPCTVRRLSLALAPLWLITGAVAPVRAQASSVTSTSAAQR